jgi:hypothetical protein
VLKHEQNRVTITNLETGRLLSETTTRSSYDGRVRAHVADDASFRDYDLTIETDQGGVQSRWVLTGLQLDQPWELYGDDPKGPQEIRWGGSTGQEYNDFDIGKAAKSVTYSGPGAVASFEQRELGAWALASMAKDAADKTLRDAYSHWMPFNDCVDITYSPPGAGKGILRMAVGKSKAVSVSTRSRKDKQLIRATAHPDFDLGLVSPQPLKLDAGRAGRLTLTAEREGNDKYTGLYVRGRSRRGAMAKRLEVIVTGVPRAYTGTVTGSARLSTALQDTTETWKATGVVFERDPSSPSSRPRYKLKAGSVQWNLSGGYLTTCAISASASLLLSEEGGGSGQIVWSGGKYTAIAGGAWTVTATATCPEVTLSQGYAPFSAVGSWLRTPDQGLPPQADGTLSGSLSLSPLPEFPGATASWQWSLAPS